MQLITGCIWSDWLVISWDVVDSSFNQFLFWVISSVWSDWMLVMKLRCIFFRMGQETKSLRFLFCKKRVGPLIVDAYVQIVSVNQIYAPLPAWNLLAIKPCLSSWGSAGLFINYFKTSAKLLANCNWSWSCQGSLKILPVEVCLVFMIKTYLVFVWLIKFEQLPDLSQCLP